MTEFNYDGRLVGGKSATSCVHKYDNNIIYNLFDVYYNEFGVCADKENEKLSTRRKLREMNYPRNIRTTMYIV